ncbi:MAG: DUF4445 domain-containing protein [Caldiserica bacterium]|nr:DUF4445 domain-containing protein [Caldisericota bacterium]
MKKLKVTFLPYKKIVEVSPGTDILTAAVLGGIGITSSCAGEGVCGRCKVIIKEGNFETEPSGRISKEEKSKGYVLACRTTIHSDLTVKIPPASRLEKASILTEEAKESRLQGMYLPGVEIAGEVELLEERFFLRSPLSTKIFLKIPPPTLEDNISDLERVYREVRKKFDIPLLQTGLANVRKLGRLLRESNWEVTVTLGKRNGTTELVMIEPGDTSSRNFGVAVDIGTTTLVAQLVDLNSGKVISTKASFNPQATFGEDIITRIIVAEKEEGLERLHHVVVDTINELIFSMADANKTALNEITAVVCAGNTTMTHLLLRVDPSYLRREPYVPTANLMPVIRAAEVGIKVHPRGLLGTLPAPATFVGGDITAGILATGLDEEKQVSSLIDIGTNGEIVIGNKEWMVCCSASAGPAFEGSGVRCGVRAREGAIQKVKIAGTNIHLETIGNTPPVGICGSGYVDLISELFRNDIIDKAGALNPNSFRVRKGPEGLEFLVVEGAHTATGEDIVITQPDIENLIRSKGAIFTAFIILLEKVGLSREKVEKIYVAGGFGNYLDIDNAIFIGLLPDLPREKFQFVGNASLRGARLSLLSYPAYMKAREISSAMTYIDLATDPEYMDRFIASLFLPHTDTSLFPSIEKELSRTEN